MTINEALRRIAALKGEIARLESRRASSISYKASRPPAFLLAEIEVSLTAARAELIDLKARLAQANATGTAAGQPLVRCIVELQELRGEIASTEALSHHTEAQAEYEEKETEYVDGKIVHVSVLHRCDLTTRTLEERLAVLRSRFASLNAAVEAANHTVSV